MKTLTLLLTNNTVWMVTATIILVAALSYIYYRTEQQERKIKSLENQVEWNYQAIKYLCEAAGYDFNSFINDVANRL